MGVKTMALPLAKVNVAQSNLVDWATQQLVEGFVPVWARQSFSTCEDESLMFMERYVLNRLFSSRVLSGIDTRCEDLINAGFANLVRSIPYYNVVRTMLKRLKTIVELESGTVVEELEQSRKFVGKELHPWVHEYRRFLASKGRTKRTILIESSIANEFLCWLSTLRKFQGSPNNISLYGLTFEDVRSYIQVLRRKVYTGEMAQSVASQKSVVTLSFLRFCIAKYGISNVVQDLHGLPQADTIDWWIPSPHEVQRFFETILQYSSEAIRDFTLFGLMYLLGLRPVEALNLEWSGVDLVDGIIEFQAKGGNTVSMALVTVLLDMLKALKRRCGSEVYVFAKTQGRKLSATDMRIRFRAYATVAGWPEESWPKTFRHAFCTHMLEQTHNYLLVNRLARHTKIETTQRYVHFTKQHFASAAEAIQNVFDLRGW
jgi:site-specific recombinase XerD